MCYIPTTCTNLFSREYQAAQIPFFFVRNFLEQCCSIFRQHLRNDRYTINLAYILNVKRKERRIILDLFKIFQKIISSFSYLDKNFSIPHLLSNFFFSSRHINRVLFLFRRINLQQAIFRSCKHFSIR